MSLFFGPAHILFTNSFNLFLDSKAARQLLIYHINAKINSGDVSGYTSDPSKPLFYGELLKMGNYPKYCKLVALSSGSLSGKNQRNYYSGLDRIPNDRLMDFGMNIKARILYIPVPLISGSLDLRTNPNGNGTFYSGSLGNYTFHINLKIFGIKIHSTFGNIYNDNQAAINVKPYCTSAGGKMGFTFFENQPASNEPPKKVANNWLINLLPYNYSYDGQGCLTFDTHLGLNGIYSLNMDFHLCSDGANFGFIPVRSALDYGDENLPLDYNIETGDDINTKIKRTPFDVIIGYPGESNKNNFGHINYRDEFINNITRTEAEGWSTSGVENSKYAYYTCAKDNIYNVKRSLLCLEIGDEELYLENLDLNRKADFQTEFDIRVNDRNPYYKYPSQSVTQNNLLGAYSKERPFQSVTGDLVNFYFDSQNSPSTAPGLSFYNPAFLGLYKEFDQPLAICCTHYSTLNHLTMPRIISSLQSNSFFRAYPNPANGESMINFDFQLSTDNQIPTISVYDLLGRKVGNFNFVKDDYSKFSKGSISLHTLNLKAGVYLIEMKTFTEQFIQKIVIQ